MLILKFIFKFASKKNYPIKLYANILIIIFTLGFLACNNNADKTTRNDKLFDCSSFSDKKAIFNIAKSIIDKHDNKQIWNLSKIDNSNILILDDYFTNPNKQNKLVLIHGEASLSSGTANNLLILFSCSDSLNILWSGQVGNIEPSDIKDLNGDEIKEIVCISNTIWMGECVNNFDIFNFKNGTQNFLFTAKSTSFIGCGLENLADKFKQGDTLENYSDCSIIELNNKEFMVKQIKTIKIHNGGKTDDEIIKKIKILIDTINVKIK